MRTITAPQRTLLGGQSLNFHLKAEIENESGTWIDVSNRVIGVDWNESIDQPVMAGTLRLTREIGTGGADSLAPLVQASLLNRDDFAAYSPLVHPGRGFRTSVAVTAAGVAPVGGDWHRVFDGILDDPEWAGEPNLITVPIRDIGGRLADQIIEVKRDYSSVAGIALEDLIELVASDNGFLGITVVMPGGSPGWMVRRAEVERGGSLFEMMRNFALQIGWDLRYRWGTGDAFELQLYDPDRTKTVADITVPPSEYLKVSKAHIGDADVRNYGLLVYVTTQGLLASVTAIDSASINTFGRRYIEIRESSTSNIDSATEAQDMIDKVIDDLSTPMADHEINTFYLWPVQLHDLVEFPSNSVHHDQTQKYAVVASQVSIAAGHMTQTLLTRGKPAGAYRQWILRHGAGPLPNAGPSPIFGEPIGEDSEGGGVSGDGMVWLDVQFDAETVEIRVFAEEAENEAPQVPDVSEITLAWSLRRQEGTESSADDWKTMLGMATRPFWYKRLRAFGVNKDGVAGPETIFEPVQALDLVSVLDGEVTDMVLTVGVDNVLDIDIGNTDPVQPSYLIVMRNGIVIRKIFIGILNNYTEQVTDAGINVNGSYTYKAFIWTSGVSGAHLTLGNTKPGDLSSLPLPGKLKIIAAQVMDLFGTPALRIDYKANVVGFARAVLEESDDNGVGDPWAASVVISQSPGQFSGSFWVADYTTPRYYRVRVDKWDGTSVYSAAMFWNAVDIPPPTGTTSVPRFVNGTPRLIWTGFGTPTVEIEYDISATAFTTMRLEVSATGITGWTEIGSNTSQRGFFYDSNTFAKFYRLRAVGGAVDLYSLPAFFAGFKEKLGGGSATDPPVFSLTIQSTGPTELDSPVLLRIAWTCTNASAVEVTVERSVDDGGTDPWVEVRRDASVAQGYWDTSAADSYYYRMKAKGSTDNTLATSASQEYQTTTFFP